MSFRLLFASCLGLFASALSAQTNYYSMPALTGLTRLSAATLRPGIDFTVKTEFRQTDSRVILLDVAFTDPNGLVRHILSNNPGTETYSSMTVTQDWSDGAYTFTSVKFVDLGGHWTTYKRDGTIEAVNGTPLGSLTHAFDFRTLDFAVTGGGTPVVLAQLTAISRASASPLGPGTKLEYDYSFTPGTDTVKSISVEYTTPLWYTDTASTGLFATPAPAKSGAVFAYGGYSTPRSGQYRVQRVILTDATGRTIAYNRDGSVVIANGPGLLPATHNFGLAALDFEITAGPDSDIPPYLIGFSLVNAGAVAPGTAVGFAFELMQYKTAMATIDVSFKGPDSVVRHAVSNASNGTVSTTTGATWPQGIYTIQAIDVTDTSLRTYHYARTGSVTSSSPVDWNYAGTPMHLTNGDFALSSTAVSVGPVINLQPANASVALGAPATFAVGASGIDPLSYQWRKNGAAIAGATSTTFRIAAVQPADAGLYSCMVSNSVGTVTSNAATLAYLGPTAWLTNVAVRTRLDAGQSPLMVGITVSGPKPVLVRAAGPALTAFGLANALADPRLELYAAGAATAAFSNDDWSSTLQSVFTQLSAFGFPVGSKDAAVAQTLDGGYSIQAPATGSGTVLVEAYDTLPGTNTPRLVNVSARNRVGTGDDILIAGFSVGGTDTKKLLIRAVGPKLAEFGVGGALSDPMVEVYDGSQTLVAQNDNWDASLAPLFTAVSAFPLTAGSKDAALAVTVAPGTYTVQVKGVGGATGEALVEIYEVP